MISVLCLIASVVFFLIAGFGWDDGPEVSWQFFGFAAWVASYLPLGDGVHPKP